MKKLGMKKQHNSQTQNYLCGSSQDGFGLIELMIAMVIGLISLAALGFVFTNARDVFSIQDGSARIQENGRFAIEMMARDIRHAGYFGCIEGKDFQRYQEERGSTIIKTNRATPDPLITTLAAVEGFQNKSNPVNPAWLPSNAALPANMDTNSDGITIRFANPDVATDLSSAMSLPYDAAINLDTSSDGYSKLNFDSGSNEGSVVVIANCDSMDVFELTDAPSASIPNPGLSSAYSSDTQLRNMVAVRYYVETLNGVSTLTRQELFDSGNVGTSPLIDGVESLQILYGSDTNGDGKVDAYENADEVQAAGRWGAISSVQIGVLANSVTPYGQDDPATNYTVLDEDLATGASGVLGDQRLRRNVFSTTIALRQK